jgi:hypothetical protein
VNSRTKHLLFLDESGTHDLRTVDPTWPVFVLLGLLVGETYYQKTLAPRVKALKRSFGLAPDTVLHSRHIRRQEGPFAILRSSDVRERFYQGLNDIFTGARLRLYVIVVDKVRFQRRSLFPENPYDVSISQLLSVVCGPPGIPGPNRPRVSRIIAESRGKREDRELQHEYQQFRTLGLGNYGAATVQNRRAETVKRLFPERVDFLRKFKVVAGLELADLAAYPIGRAFINDDWENPAYRVLATKIQAAIRFP